MTARSAAVLRALVVRPKLGFALAAGAAVSAAQILGAPQMRASTSLLLGWDTLAAGFLGTTLIIEVLIIRQNRSVLEKTADKPAVNAPAPVAPAPVVPVPAPAGPAKK